jgi:hypothetical protein
MHRDDAGELSVGKLEMRLLVLLLCCCCCCCCCSLKQTHTHTHTHTHTCFDRNLANASALRPRAPFVDRCVCVCVCVCVRVVWGCVVCVCVLCVCVCCECCMCVYMRLCARWQEEVQFRCPRCYPLSPREFLLLLPVCLQHLHTRKRRQRREKREERKKTRKQLILRIPGCSVTVTRSSRVIALWVRVLWKCCGIHSLCCGTWCVLRRTAAAWVCARARLFCLPFLLVGALLSGLQAAEGGGGEREKRGCRGLKRVSGTQEGVGDSGATQNGRVWVQPRVCATSCVFCVVCL